MAVILVVDDDPTIHLIAAEMLREDAHAVLVATDGVEAVNLIHSVPVDLAVVDMLMPNKDGLETILEIKQSKPGIRILAITSGGVLDGPDLLRTAMTFGADASMLKPLTSDTFATTVNRLLQKSVSRAADAGAA